MSAAATASTGTGRQGQDLRIIVIGAGMAGILAGIKLLEAGFVRGASFENSLVFDETRLLNVEGLRFANECARHKMLDVIGDLALAGLPLLGAYRSVRGGHKVNHAVLTALLADRSAWRVVEGERARRARPAMDAVGGMVGGLVAPAYGPDVS